MAALELFGIVRGSFRGAAEESAETASRSDIVILFGMRLWPRLIQQTPHIRSERQ